MHVSQNVSIRWELNFYDKNTCQGKGISEHNEFENSATKIQINLNDMDKNQYIYENEKQNTRTGENVEQRDGANAKADDGTTLASRIKL